jgi:tetratricopeptide (TPR) repeat protein
MRTRDSDGGLGPLPKADHNAELQRRSIDAFRTALPADKFLFRDERADDAGVDGSLELLIDSRYTNLRAQVQLKSTDAGRVNKDDSISLSVAAANLNYLLNGQSPLYVLYVASSGELRFAWARDERRRLNQENPDWMRQESVTIRFEHRLTPEALEQIHGRIRREAQFQRGVHDMLGRASVGEQVVMSIDPATLNNTDPDEAYQLLLTGGLTIVSAGYGGQVKRLAELLKPADARSPRIRLVRAYAEYATGRYQMATAYIGEASLDLDKLGDDERQLLKYIQDACEYQTGRIESEEYRGRLEAQTGGPSKGINASYTLSRLRVTMFGETDAAGRAALLDEMRGAVERLSSDPGVAEGFKLHARLVLLESEGHQSLLTSLEEMHRVRMRRDLGQGFDVASLLKSLRDPWDAWERRAEAVLQEAVGSKNPLLVADALYIRASTRVYHLLNLHLLMPLFGIPVNLPEVVLFPPRQDAEQAIKIYSQANQLEGELRARVVVAELLSLAGREEEARGIARDVLPKAQAMSYAAVEWRARAHLEGQTILNVYTERSEAAQKEDSDFRLADEDDEALKKFASDILESLKLPGERLPVIERDCLSLRDIARERLHWCRHIDLIQSLSHTEHPATHYKADPNRRCVCEKYKYESAIESTDWTALIAAFKRAYCEGCLDRSPKSGGS